MNRDQAFAIIKRTFTQSFDKDRFRGFARNMLNHIDESKASSWNSQYVKDAFREHVNRYERLGTYTSPDKEKVDVLIVHLTTKSKLERARTAIRNFVADHLKTRDEKDAALVAFVSPTEKQWRFSYVKMEYATVAKESGKVGVETRLTPARRYSYIVGEGESCHTAQVRFVDLLQDTVADPSMAAIEDAFSVEAVTKEFFTNYAEMFDGIHKALERLVAKDKTIRDEFQAKTVNVVDFAKKLMGQIVFLYFLQKKGWLGVAKGQDWGAGPCDFLRRLANGDYGKYDNFFNDVLEPLFYDTLATDRGHEAWCNRFKCRIPFLNGGLFEPLGDYDWKNTDVTIPNKLFTNAEPFEEGIKGTGILDLFDRYNFTVNEAEPLEKEVAIDPEMLGKVFENLIEENRRKGLGSYYTPREIVHYMCQESLINYLDTSLNNDKEVVPRVDIELFVHLGDQISHYEAVEARYAIRMPKSIEQNARLIDEELADITICDPAVGSGAFPVGMMAEIVRARFALTPYFNDVHDRTSYRFKRHAIHNCLYGVDIDPGAVEIAKLRLWLSLVVDEEDVKHIKPLPNLFYKIVTGNSLLGVEKDVLNHHLFQRLEDLKPRYFDEPEKDKKDRFKRQIDDTIHALTQGDETFDFEIYFSEVFHRKGGFDVVIANPPYIGEKGHKELFAEIKKGMLGEFYLGKVDIFYFFFHLALNITRSRASIAFITTNYFPTADGARKLRFDISKRASIRHLMNLGEVKLFEAALGQHNMITVLSKSKESSVIANNCITKRSGFISPSVLHDILHECDSQTHYYSVPQGDLYEGADNYIRIQGATGSGSGSSHAVLNKLAAADSRLGEVCVVNIGMRTGADKVSQSHIDDFKVTLEKGEGIYVLTDHEVAAMNLNAVERAMLLPFFKNSDIRKYHCESQNDLWLIDLTYPKYREVKWESIPHIRDHIWRFEKILKGRRSNDNGLLAIIEAGYWWCFTMRQLDFTGEKIVSPQRSLANTFALSSTHWVASMDVYFITQRLNSVGLKFVLALLNSRLYYFWLYHKGKRKGEALELYQRPLSEVPIKRIGTGEQRPFVSLVDRILTAKQRDADADVSALARQIDRLVYDLYGLNASEIKVVEDGVAW